MSATKIGLIATARKVAPKDLEYGIRLLEKNGFSILPGKHLFAESDQFAGDDRDRAEDLQSMIDHADVSTILCARGGYGTLRIVDMIDFSEVKKQGKLIAGYSDITVLHNHLVAKHQCPSLHSTMPINMEGNTPESIDSFMRALKREELKYTIPPHELDRKGSAEGILFGGNLSLVYALNGSRSLPDPEGKILFLEDLDEYLYHIDRMMLNLKRSGLLSNLAGMIVGSFTDMKDNPVPFGKTAEEIIREHIEEFEFPVCFGFPAGHIKDNRTLIMGGKTRIKIADQKLIASGFQQ